MNLAPVSKAVAGALVTVLVGYIAKHGVTLDPLVVDAIRTIIDAILAALVGFLTVYFAKPNRPY
jgi:uncharacterized membrane protein